MVTVRGAESFVAALQDLVLKHEEIGGFLHALADLALTGLGVDTVMGCSVMLRHRDETSTIVWGTLEVSAPGAAFMGDAHEPVDAGPYGQALTSGATVIIDDLLSEARWPEHTQTLRMKGVRSLLAVPLRLGSDGAAVVVFYAHTPNTFPPHRQHAAEAFGAQAARALQLSLRITSGSRRVADLRAALEARTVINLAVGILIAEHECSQEQALSILQHSAESQDVPMRLIAQRIVSTINGAAPITHFT